jgi:hypothetical protein
MPVISISTVSPCFSFSGAPSVPIHTTSPVFAEVAEQTRLADELGYAIA